MRDVVFITGCSRCEKSTGGGGGWGGGVVGCSI